MIGKPLVESVYKWKRKSNKDSPSRTEILISAKLCQNYHRENDIDDDIESLLCRRLSFHNRWSVDIFNSKTRRTEIPFVTAHKYLLKRKIETIYLSCSAINLSVNEELSNAGGTRKTRRFFASFWGYAKKKKRSMIKPFRQYFVSMLCFLVSRIEIAFTERASSHIVLLT